MTGAELVIDILAKEGINEVFGYPGGAIMPIYDALYESPVTHYLTRHEQGAGFAAVGYARSSGKLGVCMATSGPGATNLITALADAKARLGDVLHRDTHLPAPGHVGDGTLCDEVRNRPSQLSLVTPDKTLAISRVFVAIIQAAVNDH